MISYQKLLRMGLNIKEDEWEDLVYIGEKCYLFNYGEIYSTHKKLNKGGLKLVELKCMANAKWCEPKDFISLIEFRDIKINKLLDE